MQFFYDYECPFCKKGYEYLQELIGAHPEIEIEWLPVEIHPRPENSHPHTDLCCQGYYAAKELGADIYSFHTTMFQAVAVEKRNVENIEVLTDTVKALVDTEKFRSILESGKYRSQAENNNILAYEKSEVWYAPAFRMSGKKLDARGGVGVNREDLRKFLNG